MKKVIPCLLVRAGATNSDSNRAFNDLSRGKFIENEKGLFFWIKRIHYTLRRSNTSLEELTCHYLIA